MAKASVMEKSVVDELSPQYWNVTMDPLSRSVQLKVRKAPQDFAPNPTPTNAYVEANT